MEEHPTFADGGSGTVRVAAPPKPRRHGPGQSPGWFRAEADVLGRASCRTARQPGPPRVARKEQSCRTHLSRVSRFFDTFYKAARIQATCRGPRLDMQTSGQNRESRKKPVCL